MQLFRHGEVFDRRSRCRPKKKPPQAEKEAARRGR
jgi:hypothetical protein